MNEGTEQVGPPADGSPVPRTSIGAARGGRGRPLLLAAALVLLAFWGRGAAAFVAWELARDHSRCFAKEKLPAKIWSSEPREVTAWFEAQGTPFPLIPRGAGGLELVGGRYCPLLDRLAAHLYYATEDRHFSLYVIPGPARFEESFEATSGGTTVRLLRSAGTTVALVGERSEDVDAFRSTFTTSIARRRQEEGVPARY
jgi:hypothetical protein